MTVLRSRKIVTTNQTEQHSPNFINNNNKSPSPVVTEIEPITPDNKSMTNNNNNNNETTPASSTHKLGLVASSDSGRVLRRSARLSLNSASYDVIVENAVENNSSRKRKAVSVKLENVVGSGLDFTDVVVDKSSRKRKANAVKVENKDEIVEGNVSGLDVTEPNGVVVSDIGDVRSQSLNKVVLIPDLNQLADDEKLSPGIKETTEDIVSAGNVGIEINEGNVLNGRTTRGTRFSREDKNKGVVEVDSSSIESDGLDNMDEDFVLGDGPRDLNEEVGVGVMDDGVIPVPAGDDDVGVLAFGRAGTGTSSSRMRERFKDAARKNATRFAYFSHQHEDDEDLDVDDDEDDEPEPPRTEPNADNEDWPGPFSTAMKIINDRTTTTPQQKKTDSESVPLIWVPKEKQQQQQKRVKRSAPLLSDLCMRIMSQHVDAITSLESVPDILRHKLTRLLCDSRKMNHHFFDLLASGTPTEIRVRDCSWLTEEQFTETFNKIDASNLTVLQLDQCGRCLPDYVLLPILSFVPRRLSALTNISLKGACRLSDAGLKALVDSAPGLRSINLGCCSLLTVDAINNLADKLGPVLKELYIDECFDLDAKRILPALLRFEQLEVLSVAHNESVDNSFVVEFVAARGQNMKELVLANCTKLTDKAVRAISISCPGLCAIDLTNVCKLTDKSLAHLANGCPKIQILKFCRNTFSDEAVAAYLEACGAPLRELSLNHVNKVSHHTAISLGRHARNLESLDLSFCREMTNEALGLIADSCTSLKTLKLFGCTQITNVFTGGHSNDGVKIIGLAESQILKNIEAVELLPLRYSAA